MAQSESPKPGASSIPTHDAARRDGSDDDGLIGLPEAAAALGVHYMTAYRYVRTGLLDAHQADGHWRVRPSAIAAFRDARARRSGTHKDQAPRRTRPLSPAAQSRYHALADRLTVGDEGGAWRIIDHAVTSGWSSDDIYLRLIGASMQEIGDRWEAGKATVADEHRASVVAMRLIGRLGAVTTGRPGRSRGTVILGAAPGDRHALPSALLADLLRSRGMRVVDFGADTPPDHLATAAANEDRLLAVGICATTPLDDESSHLLHRAVRLVHERAAAPVLLGGQALAAPEAQEAGADGHSSATEEAIAWVESLAPATATTDRSRS